MPDRHSAKLQFTPTFDREPPKYTQKSSSEFTKLPFYQIKY
jgi:hypothetical protein